MNVLITGGAGFIGSHLVEKLVEQGQTVTVLDDLSAGKKENLSSVLHNIHFNIGTVSDLRTVETLIRCDYIEKIFHLATPCLVKGLEDPKLMHTVTDVGTFNVCLSAKDNGCKLTYISTSEIYGNLEKFPIDEESPPNPVSIYGLTKYVGEQYVRFFHEIHDLPTVIIRPFNTYGPRHREDNYSCVVTNFIKQAQKGQCPIIYGDGKQTRDFTFVDDIVEGIIMLSGFEDCSVFNIGSGFDVSMFELAKLIWKIWGYKSDPSITWMKPRPHDVRKLVADIKKAYKYGYEAKTSLEDGIKKYAEWLYPTKVFA